MSVSDKITEIKKIVTMVCEILPVIANVIKEVIVMIKDIKTA